MRKIKKVEKKEEKRKMHKMEKQKNGKYEIFEDFQSFWIHTQHARRFPWFAVVFVILFAEILDEFHNLFSECMFFFKKINNSFWRLTVFSTRKLTISIGRATKTHILQGKINEKKIAKVSLSNNNHSYKTINHSKTTIIESGEAPL